MGSKTIRTLEELLAWTVLDPTTGCRIWQGQKNLNGYGRLKVDGSQPSAHRYSYELSKGPIPEGMHVCHTCDVRACIEPSHLFAGSHQDNMTDRNSKGRQARGSKCVPATRDKGSECYNHKLVESDIQTIKQYRGQGMTYQAIANIYGVTLQNIWIVVNGRGWKHVK